VPGENIENILLKFGVEISGVSLIFRNHNRNVAKISIYLLAIFF